MNNVLNEIDKDITLLLDNLPVGIIRLNSARKCIYANKFFMELLGVKTSEDICKQHGSKIHKDDIESETRANTNFLMNNIESETTCRLYCDKYQEYRWFTNKRILIQTVESDEYSYMYTVQDVHDNKMMELQLRQETQRAEELHNHKSIFLANMSHEIRTPLNGIIGMLTLLEDTPLSNDQQDYIGMVKECSYNLMTIINDILDYSKLEVGKIVLEEKSMSLRECVESTNDIILSKVYEKNLEYTYNINHDIPSLLVGDSNRLKQILLNLLSNSIKFTEKGTIFLNIEMIKASDYTLVKNLYSKLAIDSDETEETEDPNKLYIKFDITDTGCGIERGDQDKLFKSFSQVDNRITNKVYQGTGLGLAISKELVELMGGFVWLDWSEPGKGSRFSFVIASKYSEQTCISDDDLCTDFLQGANVLIVDDNLHNRLSLAGMITKWGMKPHAYSNSEEALYFSRIMSFDIGLIDICMPKIDGPRFAARLREQTDKTQHFPLIALSSLGDKVSSLSENFVTHLVKPIKEQKLKQACVECLRQYKKLNPTPPQTQPQQTPLTHVQKIDTYIVQNQLNELRENVRILLAEDVYINQRVIVSFLNKLGYKNIKLVADGQECLDEVMANDYDIVLLDIRMPIMNGEEVLKRLCENYAKLEKRKPYVVAVTAYCSREDKDKYLSLGFDDYIPKPITYDELSRCMNEFLHRRLHD